MSHYKERKEKNCLNCNAEVQGKYCHICGQENIEPKETFWSLVTHFVYDVLHFDGKFFSTLIYLLTNPGFLSHEYLRGRRASYLHPIKMYVFTSAVFFILFFSFVANPEELGESMGKVEKGSVSKQIDQLADSLKHNIAREKDSAEIQRMTALLTSIEQFSTPEKDIFSTSADTSGISTRERSTKMKMDNGDSLNFRFMVGEVLPQTITEYDSLQHLLPEKDRDGWFKRMVKHRAILMNARYTQDPKVFWEDFLEKFLHSVPQVMFITLPLIALIMQLLYIRKRKEILYVNHVIFMTHVYIALFICFLVSFGISGLYNVTGFFLFRWLNMLVTIYIVIYTPWAMKNFYEQGIMKSLFKYVILLLVSFLLFTVVFSIFALKSFL